MDICLVEPSRVKFINVPFFSARYSKAFSSRVRPFSPLALPILLVLMIVICFSLASFRSSSLRPSCAATLPLAPAIYKPFFPITTVKPIKPVGG